jgi:hypothetical protein
MTGKAISTSKKQEEEYGCFRKQKGWHFDSGPEREA